MRCFESDKITHVNSKINPVDDLETIKTEIILSDLDIIQKKLEKGKKKLLEEKEIKILEDKLKQLNDGKEVTTNDKDEEKFIYNLMHQTHSNKVVEVKKNNYKKKVIADAMITKMKGFALGVVTADCVPIILYDAKNEIVGCIHAGWKGAFLGVIRNTISKIKKISSNNKIYACIGPCIGKKSYEVSLARKLNEKV